MLFVTLALAVPTELTHSGRMFDATGLPLQGAHDVTVSLFTSETGGTQLWTETSSVDFDGGYFTVALGSDSANELDDTMLGSPDVWVEVTVDTLTPTDRQHVTSVPYARLSGGVNGGVVDASEIRIDGSVVIDGSGDWIGTGGDGDTLGALTCSSDQVASFDGTAWRCADSSIDWTKITGIPLDIADGTDDDTLAGMSCGEGDIIMLSTGAWACGTDQYLNESQVETYITNRPVDLAAGTTVGGAAPVTSWTNLPDIPGDIADGDADTIVTWATLSGIPSDIADGDADTVYTDADAVLALETADLFLRKDSLVFPGDALFTIHSDTDGFTPDVPIFEAIVGNSSPDTRFSVDSDGDVVADGWGSFAGINSSERTGRHQYREFATDMLVNSPTDQADSFVVANYRCSGHWGSFFVEIDLVTHYYRPSVRRYSFYCGNGNYTSAGVLEEETSMHTGFSPLASLSKVNLGDSGHDHAGIDMYDGQLVVNHPPYVQSYMIVRYYGRWTIRDASGSLSTTEPVFRFETWN